jgi:hypothetical protein
VPYNGGGTFVRLFSWVVDAANSVNISSSRTDAEMNGFAAGLTNCITRDGQSPPSADIPWGGKRLTNLGVATTSTDALSRAAGDARYWQSSFALTFDASGSGIAAGTAFSGAAAATISFNSIGAAPLASPTFTGTPAAPTAAAGTNTTQVATTAFVLANAAPLASPTFTGTPLAPTAAAGTNTTQIATTAFVLANAAPLASPTFTGTPLAPTAAPGTVTTQIATTAFVSAARAPIIQTVASAATVTPDFANDQVNITAQAAALTLANPSGTAVDGWGIAIRIKDNGTARAITYGTQYRAVGTVLPTTTVISKVLYLGCIWNAQDTTFDVVSVIQQ